MPELIKDDMNNEKGVRSWCPNTLVCENYRFTKVIRGRTSFVRLSCLKKVANGKFSKADETHVKFSGDRFILIVCFGGIVGHWNIVFCRWPRS